MGQRYYATDLVVFQRLLIQRPQRDALARNRALVSRKSRSEISRWRAKSPRMTRSRGPSAYPRPKRQVRSISSAFAKPSRNRRPRCISGEPNDRNATGLVSESQRQNQLPQRPRRFDSTTSSTAASVHQTGWFIIIAWTCCTPGIFSSRRLPVRLRSSPVR